MTLARKRLFFFLIFFLGDAYHITAPSEGGYGAYLAMKNALRDADLKPEDVHYINAHATSTPLGKPPKGHLLFIQLITSGFF